MTKTEFEKLLVEEGYICEAGAQYPSVIVFDSKEVKTVSKKVRALCKKCGYDSSFAIRTYREGINTYPKAAEAETKEDMPKEATAQVIGIDSSEDNKETSAATA